MQIKVKFVDGRIELVRPRELQDLIDARRITQFRRSGGWVTLGMDPVRSTLRGDYLDSDRRTNFND